ncbi:MAG: response regulator transcription factor [Minwuiales bacterium]|nr:response regulator transcription factor [Minwuiales bacterium]
MITTIALIDGRTLTRQCLARWLERSSKDFKIIAIGQLAELDQRFDQGEDPRLVVLSLGHLTVTDEEVRTSLRQVADRLPDVPVIVLSDCEDPTAVAEAIRNGVKGYIPTTVDLSVALEALRLVQVGGTYVPASTLLTALEAQVPTCQPKEPRHGEQHPLQGFTPRELQVLELLREGKPNKVIAYELDMQESTVKVHVRHIMKKLKASNRTQAAFLAQQLAESEQELAIGGKPFLTH